MFKIFTMTQKQPDVAQDAFSEYIRSHYVPSLVEVGEGLITKVFDNRIVEMNYRRGSPTNNAGHTWNSILSFYVSERTHVSHLLDNTDFRQTADSHGHVISAVTHIPVEEILMYDYLGQDDAIKVFGFFQTSDGVTRESAQEYWFGPHADMGKEMKADTIIRKYHQNHTLQDYCNPDTRYNYDGSSEVWFRNFSDAEKIYRNSDLSPVIEEDEIRMGTHPGLVVSMAAVEIQLR